MSDYANRPEDVPAADWAEQQEDADPNLDDDAARAESGLPDLSTFEADEADLAEQHLPVFFPDDEDQLN